MFQKRELWQEIGGEKIEGGCNPQASYVLDYTSNNSFQWHLKVLTHLAGLYTGTIFDNIARKILSRY